MLGASQLQRQLNAVIEKNQIDIERNYDFTHVSTMVAMVEAGLGVGILPKVAVPKHTTLRVIQITRPAMSRTISVISMRGHSLSIASQRFVSLCCEKLTV